ncbi:MAG TPA: flagellar protein FlgN [Noviherbaspirillum sp.]|jgi:flagella synthesis protein FlgN|uniref:flagella synthesis protein FlgN n=1 Tax=Noviherbaspirillum sp. TaxID=1926288 RepID=UPI002DDD9B2B|nr:flagellar protein FlgN [Noviherbaspirillum sp.]HEV2609552.1 flagellar protein FlgN [Noviherbaspirillum sp.]
MQALGTSPADTLQEEHQAATSLLQILDEEQACLLNAETESLAGLTQKKAALVGEMTELAKRRHQSLASAGLAPNESGMQNWIGSPASSPSAGRMWKALLSLIETAREKNRVNGLLIGKYLARNQSALKVLQGSPQGGGFYGPDGQATTRSTTRSLVVG